MMTPRRNLILNSHLQMVLTVLIVLLANGFAAFHVARVDLSGERLYTLDEASKQIVQTMDRPIVARVYFTHGLGAPYQNHEQLVKDKLGEFASYARGRMTVEAVDPAVDPDSAGKAAAFGLQQLDYTFHDQDRAELRKIWMGVVLLYGDRQEVLPAVTNLDTLEYDIAAAFVRLRTKREDVKTLGWAIGDGEPDYTRDAGPVRTLASELSRKFVLRQIPLGGAGSIPEDVSAMLVIGPQTALGERALYQLDQFVMRGGALAAFVTNTRPDLRTMRPQRVSSGLDPLLGSFGVRVNRDLVLDRVQNGQMRFPVRAGGGSGYRDVNYPLIPKAIDLSKTNVMVGGTEALLFPFASTVAVSEALPMGVKAEVLAQSSESSGVVERLETLDPTKIANVLSSEKRGPFPLIVAMTGSFRSFFESRPVPPPDPDAPSVNAANPDDDGSPPAESPQQLEGASTRLVIAGSADFVANNQNFMLNLCDWLVADESLLGIRGKASSLPALRPTEPRERTAWKALQILWAPVGLLLYGAARQRRRRRPASSPRTPPSARKEPT